MAEQVSEINNLTEAIIVAVRWWDFSHEGLTELNERMRNLTSAYIMDFEDLIDYSFTIRVLSKKLAQMKGEFEQMLANRPAHEHFSRGGV